MKSLAIITQNPSKLEEFRFILEAKGYTIDNNEIKLIEPKSLDQKEVAISTAKQAYALLKKPLITDDTGIYFYNYNNFPGTYTKYLLQTIGISGIKQLMKVGNKKAYYQTTLCFTDGKRYVTFQGRLEGKISLRTSEVFNKNWGWDSVFVPIGYKKYLSEFALEERSKISHRAKAIKEMIRFLGKNSF